ncbi:hypothetical protein OCC_01304 [Thermococcus litoralis DSM 5473]|uniref:protein adenylyltransferase n=1 Tax=Thermococcus litoralis (strain ATCC 51850 / DSM 5473 / JCM 8560 / NS-C) TaxID=523849 RepID=H3ZLI6_THELN|nr:nucleotidyltransferase family protein [Thermococcus litoralis]EHR79124.1 hypothetical protein OCC_01304 [Thermococcus litoralis DSM 5473]
MKTLEEIEKILREHKEELRRKFKVKEIGIFGSYVRGEQSEVSDVDILVDFYEPLGWEIVDLKDYLESLLGVKADLVTKNGVMRKPELWKYIKGTYPCLNGITGFSLKTCLKPLRGLRNTLKG